MGLASCTGYSGVQIKESMNETRVSLKQLPALIHFQAHDSSRKGRLRWGAVPRLGRFVLPLVISIKSFTVGFTPKIHHIQVLQEAADATSGCFEAAWALRRVGSACKCETHLQLRLSGKDSIKGLCPRHERLLYCQNPVGIRRR